jgi:large subunit ribosomal protein L30
MAELKVTQVKSKIGGTKVQRASLRALGLHRIGDSVTRPDRPEFRGMIDVVRHLVQVERQRGGSPDELAPGNTEEVA